MIVKPKVTADGPVQPQPLIAKQRRSTGELATEYVEDFLGLLREGWAPDLQTFLESVPERLREEVFEQLDRAMANLDPAASDPHLEPRTVVVIQAPAPTARPKASEETASSSPRDPTAEPGPAPVPPTPRAARRLPVDPDLWVRVLGLLVPGDLRHQFVGELIEERRESRTRGESRFERNWQSFTRLLLGIAQHAPLFVPGKGLVEAPAYSRHAARWGWYAWRAVGPFLALGVVLGSAWPFLVGGGLLAATLTCLVLASKPPLHERQVRLINGALGGMVAILGLTLALGLFCALWIGLGSLVGWTWLSAIVVRLLAWSAIAVAAGICGSGWRPTPWAPSRLVRV